MPNNQPFSRYSVQDPVINKVIQDLYDKLQQAQGAINTLQTQNAELKKRVDSLTP